MKKTIGLVVGMPHGEVSWLSQQYDDDDVQLWQHVVAFMEVKLNLQCPFVEDSTEHFCIHLLDQYKEI